MKSSLFPLLSLFLVAGLGVVPPVNGQMTATVTTLHLFDDANQSGYGPAASLLRAADGAFYGTTAGGGTNGYGTIYRLSADGRTLATLHSFGTTVGEGTSTFAALIQDGSGIFYGTTPNGGTNDDGTIFRLSADGRTLTTLHRFTGAGGEGAKPQAALLLGSDGAFYGTTLAGGASGNGTVFRLSADGKTLATLHAFTGVNGDGAKPYTALIQGSNGAFYGTTYQGGASHDGTVFRLSADGKTLATLHSFTGANGDGAGPLATLIEGSDGAFYGTTYNGGAIGYGTVFRLAADEKTLTILHSFTGTAPEGVYPHAELLQGSDGAFYGTTIQGGSNGDGTIFRLAADKQTFSTLHSFTGSDGGGGTPVAALIQTGDGGLYGTTYGDNGAVLGTIYALDPLKIPVITSTISASATVGKAFAYQITATNNPTGFATSSVPPGLGFAASTGEFTGTPTRAGSFKPLLAASNSSGTGRVNLNLTVKPAAPVITSALKASAQVGVAFSYQVTATNNPTKFAISSLPPGLTFNTTTGRLSGTPTKAGSYRPLVAATNSGGSGSANVDLAVRVASPVITSDLNPPARQGVAFAYQITATNNPASYATSSVPPGLQFSASTGKFTGTPTAAGTYRPLVSASNSGGTGSVNLNLVVKSPQ